MHCAERVEYRLVTQAVYTSDWAGGWDETLSYKA